MDSQPKAITGTRLRRTRDQDVEQLSCDIEDRTSNECFTLWIRGTQLGSWPDSWDPFLPALTLFAAVRGGDLKLDGPASPALIRQARRVLRIWQRWAQLEALRPIRAVTIDAAPLSRARSARAAGTFFSGGVDSFFTLLKNHSRYDGGDYRRITHLLLVHGLDIPIENPALFATVREAASDVASAVGAQVTTVQTNIRVMLRGINWVVLAHEPAMLTAGLSQSATLDSVYIPGAYAADEVKPNAVHPLVDPLWSTEYFDVIHDGLEASRGEKIAYIARSPIALKHLRVCWENPDNSYNCGRCEKCLRTMLDLWIAGALDACQTFPDRLDRDAVRSLRIPPHLISFWEDGAARAERRGLEPSIVEGLRQVIAAAKRESRRGSVGLLTSLLRRARHRRARS